MHLSLSHLRSSRGFTLAELGIGITVLSIVMIAMITLTLTVMRGNDSNIHRLTGYYLAQEGLEGLRNVRDSNWLQNHSWNEGSDSQGDAAYWGTFFNQTGYYTIDYVPTATAMEENSMPWKLIFLGSDDTTFDDETGRLFLAHSVSSTLQFYVHDDSNAQFTYPSSPYRRIVYVSYPDPAEDIAEVTATVYWADHGKERSVEVSTVLTDWREGPL